jgi:Recombinase
MKRLRTKNDAGHYYGPLAYFLKNPIYVGEMHHGGKWFMGEHQAILDRPTFERVQDLLKSNRITRRIKHSESGTLTGSNVRSSGRKVFSLRLARLALTAAPPKRSIFSGPPKGPIVPTHRPCHAIASPTRSYCRQSFARTRGWPTLQMIAFRPSRNSPAKLKFIPK